MAIPTKNVKFVAFLRLKGLNPTQVVKEGRGKAEFHFSVNEPEWQKLKLEFDRSDYLKYAQALDAVVDLAY